MKRVGFIVSAAIVSASIGSAAAQERPFTPALTCSAVKDIVVRERDVALASGQYAYEMVHADSMACGSDESSVPAFEPSSDNPNCLAGWRCRQHNSDGNK